MQVWNSASLPVGQIRVGDKMDKTLRHGANDMFLANDADWVPSGENLMPDLTSDSWTATAGGGWSTAADWSSKAVPNASTTATIAATGTYTVTVTTPDVAASLLINDAGARVADTGTLTLGGALNITAGKFALESGGSLVGGTISTGSAGVFQFPIWEEHR